MRLGTLPAILLIITGLLSTANGQNVCSCCKNLRIPSAMRVSQHCSYIQPRRILVVAGKDMGERFRENRAMAEAIAKHINRSKVMVALVANDQVCCEKLPMRSGVFDELHLLELRKQYQVDSVLFCDLPSFNASPAGMQSEAAAVLIHIGESVSLVSIKDDYSSLDPQKRRLYLAYLSATGCHTYDSVSVSPSLFVDFMGHHMAKQIVTVWTGRP